MFFFYFHVKSVSTKGTITNKNSVQKKKNKENKNQPKISEKYENKIFARTKITG